jgi:hypothetical protein
MDLACKEFHLNKKKHAHVVELSYHAGNFSSLKRTLEACAKAKSTMACLYNIEVRPKILTQFLDTTCGVCCNFHCPVYIYI